MFDIGGPELILILLAVVVLFGPNKIPEFIQQIRKGMHYAKKAQSQFRDQMDELSNDVKKAGGNDILTDIKEIHNFTKDPVNSRLRPLDQEPPQAEEKQDSKPVESQENIDGTNNDENNQEWKPVQPKEEEIKKDNEKVYRQTETTRNIQANLSRDDDAEDI